jgi:hypothetical protein
MQRVVPIAVELVAAEINLRDFAIGHLDARRVAAGV